MQNWLQLFIQKHLLNKRKRLRFVAILLLLSIVVSTEVFWLLRQKGMAMAGTAHCSITEHTHSDECDTLCQFEEHSHSLDCYSNENADVETRAIWELSLCGVPYTDDFAYDLVAVARTQLGYAESQNNFTVDSNGNRNGYTRYGEWYGNRYGKWNAMFVSFCLYYAGVPIGSLPMSSGAEAMRVAWAETSLYYEDIEHTPQSGDLVFIDTDSNNSADKVGIISVISSSDITVILGDSNDKVEEIVYSITDSSIMSFVSTAGAPKYLNATGNERVQRSISRIALLNQVPFSLNSGEQIINYGGSNIAKDGTQVSKTIAATEIENIFDITLTIETQQKIETVYKEPDMAVVIVMDISNTMNTAFGSTNRYLAAMEAAEDFINHFAETAGEVSKLGYVAFNTDAHLIFDLQSCNTPEQATTLINEMKKETGAIITPEDYAKSNSRYTNIEAGLKMGWDMIKNTSQQNKYIIFLSDGFPTTYINGSGYDGYEPISTSGTVGKDGVFYDSVLKLYNKYGTSYSNKGAIRAREMATSIKAAGGTIFSIGVDIGGQTIQKYITQSESSSSSDRYSVVDRTGESYELGSATDPNAFKSWLGNSIGSGYYYDSTDVAGLKEAYEAIFDKIQSLREESSKAEWIACDPLPISEDEYLRPVEFIGFYDKNDNFIPLTSTNALAGKHLEGEENSAVFYTSVEQIEWDLKNSGYTSSTSAGLTTFKYKLVYRVRLRNEAAAFIENAKYDTNDTTTLMYRIFETINGEVLISDNKSLEFPIPSVKGYLGEFSFMKIDPLGGAVVGAEFTLSHDVTSCNICHGDGTSVSTVPDYIAISDESGNVSFTQIPSGHRYIMTETGVPSGYLDTGRYYWATVSYDNTSVNVASALGTSIEWDGTVLNLVPYDLPETGGSGTFGFTIIGLALISIPVLYLIIRGGRKRQE